MTLYSVLVANKPLPTIDCTGIVEITVKELRKLYPITEDTPKQPWHSMPDDAMILHAPDESAFGQLNIFEWSNPPYDLEDYNDKHYVYCIEGNWSSVFLNDLLNYLKQSIKKEQEAELIRFWAGEYDRKLKERHINIEEIELHHLENLKSEQYVRIVF
ncbi:hypothetical protein [Bacillus sp. EB01]|uniref:hypothetical protein n=1 Tax=Bacillus sp. EB01 TaxID=1347086 RepID=UPI0005C6CE99|nr:hypothetical protein [Bacillus sp. EB01]